jgi:RHS repeat-associated protein
MPAAAKDEMLASANTEEIFSLAAGVAAALDTRECANAVRGRKPHQGIFSKNRRPRINPTWVKWSGTHQDRSLAWSETVLGPTVYLYDGVNLVEELGSSGNPVARYTEVGMDEPFAELRSETTSYYEQDGIDSVTSLTSSVGAPANSYAVDSFGRQTASTGTLVNPFQYTAREFDPETNIYFYRARYYDQMVGRFLSEDRLEFAGDGPNFYAYTLNNPANYVDPMGTSDGPPPPPGVGGPPGPAQLGGFVYNYPPPKTGPLGGDALAFAHCMANCLARYFVVTGGSECTPDGRHVPGGVPNSKHCTNQALDIRPAGQDQHQVFCCALNCGAQYIQNEGDHWHIQLTPGQNGSSGLLPKPCDCNK